MALFMPEPLVVEKAARPFQHAEAKLWWGGSYIFILKYEYYI
jgi:hypothetical protein